MYKGRVISVNSNKYTLLFNGNYIECSAKGNFKGKNSILVGDFVNFSNSVIQSVCDRKNLFIRPSLANIDAVNIVIANPPEPDYFVIDNLVLECVKAGVEIYFTVNKSDLIDLYPTIYQEYSGVANKIIVTSAKTEYNVESLKEVLKGKLVAFAGQSAVGKTSLINAIFNSNYKTGDISDKTQRGKHTTTSSTIIYGDGLAVIDTPGFSVLSPLTDCKDLAKYYPEYVNLSSNCFYRGCTHTVEPDCAVKNAVENNELSKSRYVRYTKIFKDLKEGKYNEKFY